MSRVPHNGSKFEQLVAKFLFKNGYRYRKNYNKLFGSPDIAITRLKIAIFIHGCFWHAHLGCKYSKPPASNRSYWLKKLDENRKRDIEVIKRVEGNNWKAYVIWQCELNSKIKREETLNNLLSHLNSIDQKHQFIN